MSVTRLVFPVLVCVAIAVTADASAMEDEQQPLTEVPGRIDVGESVFNERDKGHCLLCHSLSSSSEPFQGNLGPVLDGVGKRLNEEQLRFRIVNSYRLNPNSIMPAYHSTEGLTQVASEFKGRPVLTAQEVEDLVAYLVAETGGMTK